MDKIQKIYHLHFPPFIKRIIDPENQRIKGFVSSTVRHLKPASLLLDAGAGECRFKEMLKDFRYIAVDSTLGDQSWNYARIDVVGSIDHLPFPTDTFDTVICTEVLEHVAEPKIVLNELFRTLKPGGLICLTTPQGWGIHQAPYDYFRFTSYALSHLFEKVGFENVHIEPSCGYFGYLANRLTVFPKMLFWQINQKWLRVALLPMELLTYIFFVFLLPSLLNAMDPLDRKRLYTLDYFVEGKKPDGQSNSIR